MTINITIISVAYKSDKATETSFNIQNFEKMANKEIFKMRFDQTSEKGENAKSMTKISN